MTEPSRLTAGSFAGAPATARSASSRGLWSSRWVFFLAATGSAVGLGNIWKFPYITGANGGGAFVLVYIACILTIGIPLLMAEVMIGRRGRQNPAGAMGRLAREAGASPHWRKVGWLGAFTGFLILGFYLVVAGWALAYVPTALSGAFSGVDGQASGALFEGLLADPGRLALYGLAVLAATLLIVGLGVRDGLERALRLLMPGLFVLLLGLVGYAAVAGDFAAALRFLFVPDFSQLSAKGVLLALGHAFFTLSLGCGAMMAYGSYLPEGTSIARTSLLVALADTVVALLAGLAIFPLVFANGLEPGAGPGLIFVTLPIAFGQMPLGQLVGGLFFIMLVLAAVTSTISLSEPGIAWLTERFGIRRGRAVLLTGSLLALLGTTCLLSFNHWAEYQLFGRTVFDTMDYLTANWLMPLGGLGTVLFTGWVLRRELVHEAVGIGRPGWFSLWWNLLRYGTPVAIVLVFLNLIGLV
ncbi:sodium-dependent transporter [Stutzerimonas stutzeri]|uniref:sodium-dependent transporter n=1 Tax=Stutzerimonas stutzeri TaxID=316 RepID=UPI000314820F|nr:sodium-dependent transporter [Stutzerimonas stutzeri]